MKKFHSMFLLLLWFMGMCSEAFEDVEINAENFPDEAFRNIIINNCDKNKDNILSTEEINSTYFIDIFDSQVANLKGIEYFTALNQINCNLNNLTELDFTKNTALTTLTYADNKLTKINVSGLQKLKTLYCPDNELTALEIKDLPNLELLDCTNNKLATLNVSNLPKLKQLLCYRNKLTALDINNLPLLEYFECAHNKITSLNMDNLPALSLLNCQDNRLAVLDVNNLQNLQSLRCQYNELTTLDVSKLVNLSWFSCNNNYLTALDLSKLQNLRMFNCSNNKITTLDISNLPRFMDFYCDHNQLIELNFSNNNELDVLYFRDNKISKIDLSSLQHLWRIDGNFEIIESADNKYYFNASKFLSECNSLLDYNFEPESIEYFCAMFIRKLNYIDDEPEEVGGFTIDAELDISSGEYIYSFKNNIDEFDDIEFIFRCVELTPRIGGCFLSIYVYPLENSTPPAITTNTLPNGSLNSPYFETLTATGQTPITWTLASGKLPSGLTLSLNRR